MKTLDDKKVNKIAKQLNKQLKEDIFGDRFLVKQIRKDRKEGVSFYCYQMIDTIDNITDEIYFVSTTDICRFNRLSLFANNFIVNKSSFWKTYNK